MDIAIIGLPLSGKTTVFNALTGADAETSAFAAHRADVRVAVVDVPDARVSVLSGMFNPRKTIRAQVRFSDVSGISTGSAKGAGLDSKVLNKRMLESLACAGAFDQMVPNRAQVMAAADLILKHAAAAASDRVVSAIPRPRTGSADGP